MGSPLLTPHFRRSVKVGSGFTLTELIVTVAIIGVLAALLFPAVGSVKDKALAAKCVGNLRGLGSAVGLNMSGNNGKWLIMDSMNGTWEKTMRDRGELDSDKSSFCPSCDPKSYTIYRTYGVTWNGVANAPDNQNIIRYTSAGNGSRNFYEINMPAITKPSKFLLMADSFTTRFNSQYHIVQGNTGMDEIHLRHNGRANVLFADFHVESLDVNGLKDIGWHMAFNKNGVITNF